MLKKCLLGTTLLFSLSTCYAGLYIAPSALYERVAAQNVSFQGIAPRWALGYDAVFSGNFYTAIELYADYPFAALNNHRSLPVPLLRPKYNAGLSILPGVVLDDYVLAFIRLGAAIGNFTDYGSRPAGFQAGIGFEYKLSAPLSLRGEYDYVQYKVLDGIGQPKANQAVLGIVYRFDCWAQQCDM